MKLYIKKKRKHLYLELHALTFSYIEVMNFVGSGFLSQVYQASPDWTKPTGPNGATIRFHLKEMNSLKFASNMHVLRVQQSMIAPFIADTDIHLHYIYSVRKRDLLISVIDWILSFQWKLWTTPSTRSHCNQCSTSLNSISYFNMYFAQNGTFGAF